MMVPSKTLLAGLALAAMGTVATAQNSNGLDKVQVPTVGKATLTMSTGEIVRGTSDSGEKRVTGVQTFANTDTSGFYGTGTLLATSGNTVEWLDWGAWPANQLIYQFSFGYGTSVTDLLAGGPGVSLTLRFHDGVTGFCADSGNAATATFSFTGLPGAPVGGGAGWLVTVDLSGGFEFCSDGSGLFGFGMNTGDTQDGTSRANGPLLCYAGTASGGADANGQIDVFDEWDGDPTTNNCLGSFFFGGGTFNFSSWYLTVTAVDKGASTGASVSNRNTTCGTAANPNNYVAAAPVIGASFACSDVSTSGGLGVFQVAYFTGLCFPTTYGHLLVNVADPGGQLLPNPGPFFFAGGVANWSVAVPKDVTFCGLGVATQTVEFGGGVKLHNAEDMTLGF